MADKKVTALSDLGTGIAGEDLLHVIDDPSGTPVNKKVSLSNVLKNLPDYVAFGQAAETVSITASAHTAAVDKWATIMTTHSSGTTVVNLAAGTTGQIKIFVIAAGSATVDVTPNSLLGSGTKATLNAIGETVVLLYTGSAWTVIGGNGYAVS